MNIYFSGLGGVGIGPLALVARDMGHTVSGSNDVESRYTKIMQDHGISVTIGQDGSALQAAHEVQQIDWFVYTAALPEDHPELVYAKSNGIRTSLRGPFVNQLLADKQLNLIAISGTHGKTTTTGMVVWALKQLNIPISYAVGTNLSFGPSGAYQEGSRVFIYEADEYAQQFLDFHPHASIITTMEHDHPDSYPTAPEYYRAFDQFIDQSNYVYAWKEDMQKLTAQHDNLTVWPKSTDLGLITLPGVHNRQNAFLAAQLLKAILPDTYGFNEIFAALDSFPGTERRFEMLAENIITDYGHHPTEISAVIQMAQELSSSVTVIYQPHQNQRQHEIMANGGYGKAFEGADKVYWLPTYLSREDSSQETLTIEQLAASSTSAKIIVPSQMDEQLTNAIVEAVKQDSLVVMITAGDADQWLRNQLPKIEASRTA